LASNQKVPGSTPGGCTKKIQMIFDFIADAISEFFSIGVSEAVNRTEERIYKRNRLFRIIFILVILALVIWGLAKSDIKII
jgi:hypothetical protein